MNIYNMNLEAGTYVLTNFSDKVIVGVLVDVQEQENVIGRVISAIEAHVHDGQENPPQQVSGIEFKLIGAPNVSFLAKVNGYNYEFNLEKVPIIERSANDFVLTKSTLKMMADGKIFAAGVTTNSPEGVFMCSGRQGESLDWVAKRGDGFHDWAIYTAFSKAGETVDWITKHGEKVKDLASVRKLVKCDESALKLYRQ